MAAAEEKAICIHCNKEVAKANLPMHEAHCQRFLCVCPECDEQVPKEQLEEHRLEEHTLVKCKQCKMKMEKCKLAEHEINECTERLESCEFCQLNLPWSNLQEHIVACGSRTERCEHCNQYVRLKDQVQHAQACISEDHGLPCERLHKPVKQPVSKYMTPLLTDTIQKDTLGDVLAHGQSGLYGDLSRDLANKESKNPSLSLSDLQKKKYSSKPEWANQEQISTCPLCHLALPVRTLKWHEDKCRIYDSLKQKK